jgi:hypothetical protein
MKSTHLWLVGAIAAVGAMACGKSSDSPSASDSSTLHVTGTVEGRQLDNASALAIGSDGHTYAAYVQQSGRFALDLPVGHVYRIVFANSTASGDLRTIGHLVNPTSQGSANVLAIHEAGTWNLGTVSLASATSVHPACAACSSGGVGSPSGSAQGESAQGENDQGENHDGDDDDDQNDDDQGDFKCRQADDDHDRSCDDGDDVELHASNAPGDKCGRHDDDDQGEPASGTRVCKHGGDDDDDDNAQGNNAQGENDQGDDDQGSNAQGENGQGGHAQGASGGSSGSCACTAPPVTCSCSSQCGAGQACVASKCQAASASGSP